MDLMKNTQIKIDNTTITIKYYLLEEFSKLVFNTSYLNSKKEINRYIRDLIKNNHLEDKKDKSQLVSMYLFYDCISEAKKSQEDIFDIFPF